jgi:hypothetical protein
VSIVQTLPSLQLGGAPAAHVPAWQVSSPLHTVPSGHGVSFATAVFWQPRTALQLSVVHTFPSLQLRAVPAVHVPPWQVSAPLHTVESAHGVPFATGVVSQPVTGSQESVVQTLPSLQVSGVPAVQVPPWQVSAPLQTVPSAHDVPFVTFVCWQPETGLQESVVQTFPSLQLRAVPVVHVPAWQVSAPLQTVPSGHGVSLATAVFSQPSTASHVSVVHTFPSLQLSGVPAVQVPLWQVSFPLQTVPSAHEVPFVTFVCWQPETALQESVVHTFPSLQLSGVPAVHVPLWQVSFPLQRVASGHAVPFATGLF